MDKAEQIKFIIQLMDNVKNQLLIDILCGKTPEEQDGIELRWLFAERANGCVFKDIGGKARKREFNNTVLVNNL